MPRIHDISVPLVNGGAVYAGNPEIRIAPQQAIAAGASANVSSLAFGSHTGTHVDAPRHFADAAPGIDLVPLEKLIGPAVVLQFSNDVRAIGATDLEAQDLQGRRRVLLKTGNSALLARPEFVSDYTYLAPDGAEYLAAHGVELVGIDYYSVEQFHSGHHLTHKTLFAHNVVIVEGLLLTGIAPGRYQLICLPLRLAGLDGAPARAVLVDE
jgi:arylformamidase